MTSLEAITNVLKVKQARTRSDSYIPPTPNPGVSVGDSPAAVTGIFGAPTGAEGIAANQVFDLRNSPYFRFYTAVQTWDIEGGGYSMINVTYVPQAGDITNLHCFTAVGINLELPDTQVQALLGPPAIVGPVSNWSVPGFPLFQRVLSWPVGDVVEQASSPTGPWVARRVEACTG